MKHVAAINLKSIRKYNPANLSDTDVINNYVCRSKVFDKLINEIDSETKESIPQHHLIVGQRGMGKTTLLKRIEVEIRTNKNLKDRLVPVQFPEEQYNIDRLSKFWFNTLDILVDYIDTSKPKEARTFDLKINEIKKENDENILAQEAYKLIEEIIEYIGKRPVLLIDNIDQLFSLLKETELWDIRQKITDNSAPIFIGASSSSFDEVFSYYQPFYDHFKLTYLDPLTENQFTDLILRLSDNIENEEIRNDFFKNRTRIKSLFRLAGGNIRTAIILFSSLSNGFGKSISDDLDELLDEMTPIYKARIEELSNQLKAIVDEIALEHNPIDLIALRERTKMSNNTLSPQVKRLRQMGWLTTENAIKGRGNYYEITERFFNVWYLMRRSTRRNKKNISALSSFLNEWIDQKETKGEQLLSQQIRNSSDISTRLALSELLPDGELKKSLKEHAKDGVYELSKSDPSILKEFSEYREDHKTNKVEHWSIKFKALVLEMKDNEAEEHLRIQLINSSIKDKKYVLFALGNLYQLNYNKHKESEAEYKKALELDPNYVDAYNTLGKLYQIHLKKYEESETAYKKALELDPNNFHALNGLGYLYQYQKHNYPDAKIFYQKALEINPNFVSSLIGLANLYQYHFISFSKAKKIYQKALEIDPSNQLVYYSLGNLYQHLSTNYKESEINYRKALELDSEYAEALNGLGNLYMSHLKKYSAAKISYEKAIELNSNYTHPLNGLGNLYHDHLNDNEKALDCYKKALKIDNTEIAVVYNLVFLLRDILGKDKEARNYFNNSIKYENTEFQDVYHLHTCLFHIYDKNFGLANQKLEEAISKLKDRKLSASMDDWIRFAAVAIEKGFGTIMIEQFHEHKLDIIMRPYYEACVALHSGGEDHIHRQAAEVRDTAFDIYEYLKKYKEKLYKGG